MSEPIIGWDIGGAHLKAALTDNARQIRRVALVPCQLWQGLTQLQQAMQTVLTEFNAPVQTHVVTMTGELVDLFDTREQGVRQIAAAAAAILNNDILLYAGKQGFVKASELTSRQCNAIASMNWYASASVAAQAVEQGLFVDIGSTTTDILVLSAGRVAAIGYNDYQRLITEELLYTGVVRTAVMALAQRVRFKGVDMGLMAEYFATMADVYRVTGDLNERHDCSPAADGGVKTPLASALRLSRMTGYPFDASEWEIWIEFALNLKNLQKERIGQACRRHLQRLDGPRQKKIVGAGIGRFLIEEICTDMDLPYVDFNALIDHRLANADIDIADCAPAAALIELYANGNNTHKKHS